MQYKKNAKKQNHFGDQLEVDLGQQVLGIQIENV